MDGWLGCWMKCWAGKLRMCLLNFHIEDGGIITPKWKQKETTMYVSFLNTCTHTHIHLQSSFMYGKHFHWCWDVTTNPRSKLTLNGRVHLLSEKPQIIAIHPKLALKISDVATCERVCVWVRRVILVVTYMYIHVWQTNGHPPKRHQPGNSKKRNFSRCANWASGYANDWNCWSLGDDPLLWCWSSAFVCLQMEVLESANDMCCAVSPNISSVVAVEGSSPRKVVATAVGQKHKRNCV